MGGPPDAMAWQGHLGVASSGRKQWCSAQMGPGAGLTVRVAPLCRGVRAGPRRFLPMGTSYLLVLFSWLVQLRVAKGALPCQSLPQLLPGAPTGVNTV